ncbi:MAG: cysteine desulfurase family protein, partial [Patescibacteria group bacterium]
MSRHQYYFDHAATAPLDPAVLKTMMPYLMKKYGNPSNLYALGRKANHAIAEATEIITDLLDCRSDEFVFTGSATEADNLAILGVARANKYRGNRIIVSQIEHKGILSVCEVLKKEGFDIVELPIGKDGLVSLPELKKALNDKTILVSITYADSETGTIQPIREIADMIAPPLPANDNLMASAVSRSREQSSEERSERGRAVPDRSDTGIAKKYPLFHTDASQAAAYLKINVGKLGVDLMTLSAHKLGGPKGIGGLYIRRGTKIDPIIHGGGQQGRLRSGTENVPGIVGFAEAMRLNNKHKKVQSTRIKKMRDILEKGIFKSISKVVFNGHPIKRLPNYLNISILDIEGEAMLLHLDELGIMVNTGSACNSQSLEPSY